MKNGGRSLFLDYSIDGVRYKEYLKMYLVQEKTRLDKMQNEETLKIAQAAKAKKILAIQNNKVKLRGRNAGEISLCDYLLQQAEDYAARGKENYGETLVKLAKKIDAYCGPIQIRAVDKKWLSGFTLHLKKSGLGEGTIHTYFSTLNTQFFRAYRSDIIDENPISKMGRGERPPRPDSEREYLTLDEVKIIMDTPCRSEVSKRAFLFACFSGLRISDLQQLKWDNIKATTDGGLQIEKRQKKTNSFVYIPITENALKQLPARSPVSDYVFFGLPNRNNVAYYIKRLVQDAGINKHITFHCSRHTYATLLLTYGADIYTVSSLLGHKDISTTQVYAKVVNQKKKQAVSLIPTIG